jgi:nitroimidazol reductase NimA-like FMN-containing flavoprotein (pyridoxamine 5'-phosphate oxidase superfamily)
VKLTDTRTGIEVIDRAACLDLLDAHSFGRLAAVSGGQPILVPVNYTLYEGAVVFRTAAGAKLTAAVSGAPVAFEIDHVDAARQTGWSVVVSGWAEEVIGRSAIERLEHLPLRTWAPGERDHWVTIRPDGITGRRVVARGPEELK